MFTQLMAEEPGLNPVWGKNMFILYINCFYNYGTNKQLWNPAVVAWFVRAPVFHSVNSAFPQQTVDQILLEAIDELILAD